MSVCKIHLVCGQTVHTLELHDGHMNYIDIPFPDKITFQKDENRQIYGIEVGEDLADQMFSMAKAYEENIANLKADLIREKNRSDDTYLANIKLCDEITKLEKRLKFVSQEAEDDFAIVTPDEDLL